MNDIILLAKDMFSFNCWDFLYNNSRKDFDIQINSFKTKLEDIFLNKIILNKNSDYNSENYLRVTNIEMITKDYSPSNNGRDLTWENINRPWARLKGNKLVTVYHQDTGDSVSSYTGESRIEFIPNNVLKGKFTYEFLTEEEYSDLVKNIFLNMLLFKKEGD